MILIKYWVHRSLSLDMIALEKHVSAAINSVKNCTILWSFAYKEKRIDHQTDLMGCTCSRKSRLVECINIITFGMPDKQRELPFIIWVVLVFNWPRLCSVDSSQITKRLFFQPFFVPVYCKPARIEIQVIGPVFDFSLVQCIAPVKRGATENGGQSGMVFPVVRHFRVRLC